jgi:hypothetical protein
MVAEVIVERQRDRERLEPTPSGDGRGKVRQLHEPVVVPQIRKLAREPCPGDWRDELVPTVPVAICHIVVDEDEPGPAIGGP